MYIPVTHSHIDLMVITVILLRLGVPVISYAVSRHAILLLSRLSIHFFHSLTSREIIQAVIHQLEKELEEAMIKPPQYNMSGCTCTLVYLNNNELTIANVGDTQFFSSSLFLPVEPILEGRMTWLSLPKFMMLLMTKIESDGLEVGLLHVHDSFLMIYCSKRRSTDPSWLYRFTHFFCVSYTLRFHWFSFVSSRNS